MTVLAIADGVNGLALVVFAIVLAITLLITYWASKRTHSATEFWAANRGISGLQNGFAIAGDYLSASTFLGFAGLIFLFGVDGWVGLAAAGASFLPVVLLLAERMRNSGKFTMADVLSFRLRERPARIAAALGTLVVSFVYLIAQMVGAGVLLQALAGLDFTISVTITGTFMLIYVIFGGMLATTWVQIIKAGLLMIAGTVLTILVLSKAGFNPFELFERAAANHPEGDGYLASGLQHPNAINSISFGLALLLGTAGLPHLLMRFFTVPDAKAARGSIAWGVLLIGAFFIMTMLVGVGARAVLGDLSADETAGGNLVTPLLAESLGGGEGSVGGDLFLAIISAVAFATILAVVAGLVIAASGAVAHDVWTGVIRRGSGDEHDEVRVARIASVSLGVAGDRGVDPRGRDVQRLDPRRARVRGGGEREPAGAAHGAVLAAVQHDGRDRRRARRPAVVAASSSRSARRCGRGRTARARRSRSRTRRSSRSRPASSPAGSGRC